MLRIVVLMSLLAALATSAAAATAVPGPELPVWVFFTDKGTMEDDAGAFTIAAERLTERALLRRARHAPGGPLVTWADLPNDPTYLAWLRDHGFAIRAESRWLAAVSVVAGPEDLALLTRQPFVARLEPVRASATRDLPTRPAPPPPNGRDGALEYGGSLPALAQVNVPAVHALGFHGEGVVIGMLDSGFDTTHEALVDVDVLGAWDFVNDDPVVADEPGDPAGQDSHGTTTLSTIGGYKPGSLIGPAFAASFYLAKTEDIGQEVPIEEDFWVEGLEWLETRGCDLVTSSLCYADWYNFADYDGNTCVTTVAADAAAARGLAVFNSAGNYRWSTGTIAAPADGDSVIAVGAVEITGEIAGFSSPGPTADGRIKPDVCALGDGNYVVAPGTLDQYNYASGTSYSCPLTAGVAALLLSAHPGTSPWLLREALRETASQADAPNNDFGWGIIDALAALQSLQTTGVSDAPVATATPLQLHGSRPNPFNPSTTIPFTIARPMAVALDVLDIQGRLVRHLQTGVLPAGDHTARWDGRDADGAAVAGGVYLARLTGEGARAMTKLLLLK
jgi:hypothetical protein